MSSSTSPNDAEISAAAEQLASLEVTDGQADAKSSDDTSSDGDSDGAACQSEEEGERGVDPELWKPYPPSEEFPVCFVPLPLREDESAYLVCCGKTVCSACMAETARATRVINTKRAKKKLPPIDLPCASCRKIRVFGSLKSEYEERIRKGDGQAACNLAFEYRYGDARNAIRQDFGKSLELFHHAADDLGYSVAVGALGNMYFHGKHGAAKDEARGRKYFEDAVKMGDVRARGFLGWIDAEEENDDLAIRHWKLAAASGEKSSMENLWKCFFEGHLEKAELEETLRAHKEACDAMNSEERERSRLFEKTKEAGNALHELLRIYYKGDINTKQLKGAMKVLKEQE